MGLSSQYMVAIDLGSNSFHMAVARLVQDELRWVDRISDKVQLGGADFNETGVLSDAVQEQALVSLERFKRRLTELPNPLIRIVGTNALRRAKNSRLFLKKVHKLLGVEPEIISGREEARLIYLGVAHAMSDDKPRRLVFDIGGGSTELIIGERFEPRLLESLHMGCVSYMQSFFEGGQLTEIRYESAVMAARQELLGIRQAYVNLGWDEVLGASGSVKAIVQIAQAYGGQADELDFEQLKKIKKQMLKSHSSALIDLPSLQDERRSLLPSGLAILEALFIELDLKTVRYSDGALREGLLYDQLGRLSHEDVRERSLQAFLKRTHTDLVQANAVMETALFLFDSVTSTWKTDPDILKDLLRKSALLHETGLFVAHSQFHKHGAYLIRHTDLSGFSCQEQEALALLVRSHRRKFPMDEFLQIEQNWQGELVFVAVLLRLAVLFRHSRESEWLFEAKLVFSPALIELTLDGRWLDSHPVVKADLIQEVNYLKRVGVVLVLIQ
jgi:exopolyphosphatase/guanosine-5'-triphosphate,3'-diphosphate pyrophosphatase